MSVEPTARKLATLAALIAIAAPAQAQLSTTDTRLLAQPAVSATQIAFGYAGDLWTAKLDGSDVRRLTTAEGDETNPVFSPDGRWIAFAGNYDGNQDVYLVPAAGGEPRRLTWHPGADAPMAFTPDGKRVLFLSGRADYSNRYAQLWTVAVEGGPETRVPIPNAAEATYSPDGRSIDRLQPDLPGIRAVERLPRRDDVGDLADRHRHLGSREDSSARGPQQRRGRDVDRA